MNKELKTELLKLLDEYRLSEISDCNDWQSEPSEDKKVIEIAAAITKLENEPVDEIKLEEQG